MIALTSKLIKIDFHINSHTDLNTLLTAEVCAQALDSNIYLKINKSVFNN